MPITTSEQSVTRAMNAALLRAQERRELEQREKDMRAMGAEIAATIAQNLVLQLSPLFRQLVDRSKISTIQVQDMAKAIAKDIDRVKFSKEDMSEITKVIVKAMQGVQIHAPSITVPEMKMPAIPKPDVKVTVPRPEVNVTVPRPQVNVTTPEIKMPEYMGVHGEVSIAGVNGRRPLAVMVHDMKGNPITSFGGSSGPRFVEMRPKEDKPLGYEQLAVSSSAVAFTDVPATANKAVVVIEDATIRWREDGTAPTSSVGTKSFVNTTIVIEGRERIGGFQAIREGTSDASLSINYYETK